MENKDLIAKIQREYKQAVDYKQPKLDKWIANLKLYNNQKKDEKKIGHPLLFTVMQSIIANLYRDRLDVVFSPRAEGDEDTADNLTKMAEYDYELMRKDVLDYYWDWDACFFGRGFVLLSEFVKDKKAGYIAPKPEILDPLVLLHDPYATEVANARYVGWITHATKWELERSGLYENLGSLDKENDNDSYYKKAKQARTDSAGQNEPNTEDDDYELLHWFTFDDEGKRIFVTLANKRSLVIRRTEVKGDAFPVIDRALYPTSHEWDGLSIPDLVGDEQKAIANMKNLGVEVTQAGLYPMYLYDKNQIANASDLDFAFNKAIGVNNVSNAVQPIVPVQPNANLVDYIINSLEKSAQRAVATSDTQAGVIEDTKRTASEITLAANNSSARYGLSAKVFGWSEKEFWYQWYKLYKDNFKDGIDEKVIRLTGVLGRSNKPLKRENIVAEIDPDIKVESRVVKEADKARELQMLTNVVALAGKVPEANMKFGIKKIAETSGLTRSDIEQLFPKTQDEYQAEEENNLLNKDEFVPVLPEDDHQTHIIIHAKASDTSTTYAHVRTHIEALRLKKINPSAFPMEQSDVDAEPMSPNQEMGTMGGMPTASYNNLQQ